MEFYRETPRFGEGRRRKLLENTSRTSNKILVGIHSSGQGCAGVHLAESGLRFNSHRQMLIWPAHAPAGYNQALKLKGAKTCV
jgi:hypothetical protein